MVSSKLSSAFSVWKFSCKMPIFLSLSQPAGLEGRIIWLQIPSLLQVILERSSHLHGTESPESCHFFSSVQGGYWPVQVTTDRDWFTITERKCLLVYRFSLRKWVFVVSANFPLQIPQLSRLLHSSSKNIGQKRLCSPVQMYVVVIYTQQCR